MSPARADDIERLYRDRYRAFWRLAAAVTHDAELGHEAVQEGFARAWAARRAFRGEGTLEGWVWRIVLRQAAGLRAVPPVLPVPDVEVDLPFPERDLALAAAVRALPPRRRLVVFLRFFADLDYATIAEVTGLEVGTVSATLVQAKAELRRRLAANEEVTTS